MKVDGALEPTMQEFRWEPPGAPKGALLLYYTVESPWSKYPDWKYFAIEIDALRKKQPISRQSIRVKIRRSLQNCKKHLPPAFCGTRFPAMKRTIGHTALEIVKGDITALAVDAIVNAANRYLAHGGGVALAIVRKGGLSIQTESALHIAKRGPLRTGEAVITGGGKLTAKFVIHTVGPVWSDHNPMEADRFLCEAVSNSLKLAEEKRLISIALPAISTGIYGFPIQRAAPLMLREAAKHLAGQPGFERVVFCLYDDASYQVFESAFAAL
jgi:O-acetyl-ADP-ribose deacetylase